MTGLASPEGMIAERPFDDRHVPMAGTKSPWLRRRNIRWSDILDEPWVLPPPELAVWSHLAHSFEAAGMPPPHVTVGTMSILAHQHLLATGRFLTLLPFSMLRFGAGSHSIRPLPMQSPIKPVPVLALTLKSRTLNPVVEMIVRQARDVAARSGA
jgi:DNA-binding transcriptional LysR family regulator